MLRVGHSAVNKKERPLHRIAAATRDRKQELLKKKELDFSKRQKTGVNNRSSGAV